MKLEGLPEGVECVRIGIAGPEEFELFGPQILKGGRNNSITHVVVRPESGWEFVLHGGFSFVAVRRFIPPVQINLKPFRFVVNNSLEQQMVTDALAALAKLPGYEEF